MMGFSRNSADGSVRFDAWGMDMWLLACSCSVLSKYRAAGPPSPIPCRVPIRLQEAGC